jgi:glycerol-3-phosphate acyltransferase PlsY
VTLSVAVSAIIVFAIRVYLGLAPWVDVWYGVIALALLVWALRPNIKKLFAGNERVVQYSLYGVIRERRKHTQPK